MVEMLKADRHIAVYLERAARQLAQGNESESRVRDSRGSDSRGSDSRGDEMGTKNANDDPWIDRGTPEMSRLQRAFGAMTEAVRAREQAQQEFASIAAHDLRTPLSLIAGAARMLQKPDVPAEEFQAWLDCIIRNTTILQILVEDFHDGALSRSGHLKMRRDELDLCALTTEVVRDCDAVIDSHPIRMEGEGACWVLGDASRLKRLVFNLVSNAVKYSEAGREVNVSVWRHGAHICMKVEDEGKGIPAIRTERLFLPHTRLDQTRSMAEGDGLGLASVKRIADAHGAEIYMQGTPGRGTTVEIFFKVHNRTSVATRNEQKGAASPARSNRDNEQVDRKIV